MSSAVLNKYASYSEAQWDQQSIICQQEPSGRTWKKYAIYTLSLHFNNLLSRLDSLIHTLLSAIGIPYTPRWEWWNHIITHNGAALYLGALPLTQKIFGKIVRNDADSLEHLGIQAVLSVTEPFENNAQGNFHSAITPLQWRQKNIRHLQIATPDFGTIALEKIHQGVEFIHWNIQAGHSVYVHCKAGRGRSALVELCYLMKYHHLNAEQALETLIQHRRQVALDAHKWATAKEYEQLLKSSF